MNEDYVVRYGNVWLLTDDMETKIDWVDERAVASRHTKEWADAFAKKMQQQNCMVDVMTFEMAMKVAERSRMDKLRSAYFYAFEAEVRRLAPETDFYSPGLGCATYCFGVDPNFGEKIPVKKAAAKWLKDYKKRKKAG